MPVFNRNRHSSSGAVAAAFIIENSIRLNDDDSAQMEHTTGGTPTDASKGIIGSWVKLCTFGTNRTLWDSASEAFGSYFGTADQIKVVDDASTTLISTQVFRDPSAWFQVTQSYDSDEGAAADRLKIYINGTEITAWATDSRSNITSAEAWGFTIDGAVKVIGDNSGGSQQFDGYLAQTFLIDGLSIQNDDFAITDFVGNDDNGAPIPVDISTYTFGTNGWLLDYAVAPGTGNGAGTDVSGNANHFTDAGLAANDKTLDSPSDDADNNIGNYCTWNPIGPKGTATTGVSNGNLTTTNVPTCRINGTITLTSGKYFYMMDGDVSNSANPMGIVTDLDDGSGTVHGAGTGPAYLMYGKTTTVLVAISEGTLITSDAISAYSEAEDKICCAIDCDAKKIWFGLWDNSASSMQWMDSSGTMRTSDEPGLGTNETYGSIVGTAWTPVHQHDNPPDINYDFGQLGFAGGPPLPSNFKGIATCHLPAPAAGGDPSKYFQVDTFTGTGAELVRTLTDAAGDAVSPDLVWIKDRDTSVEHVLTDSARGATKELNSNATSDESTVAQGLKSFNASGYTLGTDASYNTSSSPNVAWCWVEGATQGFDIVQDVGTGSAHTVSHSLGAVPELIMRKGRDNTGSGENWRVYHHKNTTAPETDFLALNNTASTIDSAEPWNDTAPTSSVFTIGTQTQVNENLKNYVTYLFVGVEGHSKFGSYVGNSNANGPFVWCGFAPRWILVKKTTSAGGTYDSWLIHDTAREPNNPMDKDLAADATWYEDYAISAVFGDSLSNGFKIRATDAYHNASGVVYIFAAFAEFPFGGLNVAQARAR